MKGETIPRLELMAILVLAQLLHSIAVALEPCVTINNIMCWSDSKVALYWLHGKANKQKRFIENRVKQIVSLVAKQNWNYCPSQMNPADIVSRGSSLSQLAKNDLWWEGPTFLKHDQSHWPKFELQSEAIEDSIEPELNVCTFLSTNIPVIELNEIIPCDRFSCFYRLIRVTTLVLKFVKLLSRTISKETHADMYPADISEEAKTLWYREAQKTFTSLKNLEETKRQLRVFSDTKGVLRVGGRIDNASLPYSTKFPVWLPRTHYISRLIILKSHEIVKHNGVRETLTQLRSEYWITKGRQVVKSILSKCVPCKAIMGKAYDTTYAPPLPPFRVSDDAAFSQLGVDFAGPLYVRDVYGNSKQSHKCYVVVFSCASTRAIHLEIIPDLQGSSFIRALKRFMGRRGIPARILSDNGKTFLDRAVQVFVNSKGKPSLMKRSIAHLYPVEVRDISDSNTNKDEQQSDEPNITLVRDEDVSEQII